MPKELFFKISTSKRNKLLEACISEFTTKQFSDVSVNTIIKKTGISRGSFYTYFENLEECFTYIIKDVRDQRIKCGLSLLTEEKNDYFSMLRKLYAFDYDNYSESGKYSLFKNYIYFLQSNHAGNLKDNMIIDLMKSLKQKGINFNEIMGIESLNLSEEEFLDLIEVVILLMVNTFLKSENEGLSKEESIRLFNRRIDLIEFGVRKK